MAASTEVERKFDVDAAAAAPSFTRVAVVAREEPLAPQSLDAEYFDTSAGDLAAHRITLRRRTGGPDAGWHLKLPAGPDTRTEVRLPLDASPPEAVPEALVDTIRAVIRDRPLAPVARIATTRETVVLRDTDGGVLAEFCDDRVVAWTPGSGDRGGIELGWREWEVELGTGDPELLDPLGALLVDAGATPAAFPSKLARLLGDSPPRRRHPTDPLQRAVAEQVDALLCWDRAVRADTDDAVHQMRVTIRKIRSLLQAGVIAADPRLIDELRQLGAVLGAARDAEVLADRYRSALDRLPPELVCGPVRERLVGGAERRYRTALRRALTAMRSPRYFALLDDLDALLDHPPETPAAAPATITGAYRRVRKAAKASAQAGAQHRDEALHRIRKAAKRLRYTATAAGEAKIATRAEVVQTLLGEHQDSVVSRKHLRQQAAAAHAAGEDTFTYGLLYQQEEDLAADRRAQLPAALRRLRKAVRRARR